jgi:molybdate transport system substrate-binding protein
MRRTALTPAVVVTAGLLLAGCGSSGTTGASSAAPSAAVSGLPALSGTVNVFAAASLKEAFTKLGQQFDAAHPSTKVVFNFGPSSGLALAPALVWRPRSLPARPPTSSPRPASRTWTR